jgi:CelD/BcsL family acetyltransferase involved in cellulose biosynthesis
LITFRPVEDFVALGRMWRDLEQRAAGSFFQSWAWVGCLVEERFSDPWLLAARRGDRVVALGLFNRAAVPPLDLRCAFWLGESGDPAWDSVFIEHNGLLTDSDEPESLTASCWEALESTGGRASWVLGGVSASQSAALPAGRRVRVLATRPAPYVDFSTLDGAIPLLDQLSANTRQQLRRSLRAWAEIGPLSLAIASTPAEAETWLGRLKAFHQAYWTGRGKPGAFAEPRFERFHRALIGRAASRQSIDLIRISAGDRDVGYLYNFVHDGWVAAYQSGFDFGPDAERLRPGLVCHLLAIEHYRAAAMRLYDFLGGEARYKRSFANAERNLFWLRARRVPAFLSSLGRSRSE